MHLAKVWQVRPFAGKISVSAERAGVGLSFNAMAFDKHYVGLRALAEIVFSIRGDRHDGSFEYWHRVQSHAARLSDRRRL
jgi:hypothetical protein